MDKEYLKNLLDSLLWLVKFDWCEEDYKIVKKLVEEIKEKYGIN